MQINRNHISQLLKDFEFESLLVEELGWDRYSGEIAKLKSEKRGLTQANIY